jgi:hypothetical protein
MSIWNRSDRISEIYGTLIAIALAIYFFVMYAFGVAHYIELRLLNLVILMGGVYAALKQYRRTHNGQLNYFRGLTVGVAASTIGVTTFAAILFIVLKLDKDFMIAILGKEPMGQYLNPYIATAAIMMEGVMSGFFVTFLLLNWINTDRVSDPIGPSGSEPFAKDQG